MEIYRLSGPILFIICSLSVCAVFERLSHIIKEKTDANFSSIEKWRHLHALACDCVDRIKDCFGLVLLIDTSCIFIRVISSSFQVYLGYRQQSFRWRLLNSLNTFELCMQLWLLALVCDKISSYVRIRKNVNKSLFFSPQINDFFRTVGKGLYEVRT
jgi:hypothetical protein